MKSVVFYIYYGKQIKRLFSSHPGETNRKFKTVMYFVPPSFFCLFFPNKIKIFCLYSKRHDVGDISENLPPIKTLLAKCWNIKKTTGMSILSRTLYHQIEVANKRAQKSAKHKSGQMKNFRVRYRFSSTCQLLGHAKEEYIFKIVSAHITQWRTSSF